MQLGRRAVAQHWLPARRRSSVSVLDQFARSVESRRRRRAGSAARRRSARTGSGSSRPAPRDRRASARCTAPGDRRRGCCTCRAGTACSTPSPSRAGSGSSSAATPMSVEAGRHRPRRHRHRHRVGGASSSSSCRWTRPSRLAPLSLRNTSTCCPTRPSPRAWTAAARCSGRARRPSPRTRPCSGRRRSAPSTTDRPTPRTSSPSSPLRSGQRRSRRQQPELDLALVAAAADLVPAGAVDALVAADVGGLGDEGRVGGAVREVEEERLARVGRLAFLHEGDRPVGEVVGEEVARRVLVPFDDVVVVDEPMRMVQVRERLEEAVVPLEAALHRPRVLAGRRRTVGVAAEVPLADREGGVAVRRGGSRPQWRRWRRARPGSRGSPGRPG